MHRGNVNEFLDKLRLEFGNRLAAKHLEQARHMDLSIPSFREQLKLLINFSVFGEMQITRESSPGWTREQPPCLQSAWLLAQDECSIFQNQNKWHREMCRLPLSGCPPDLPPRHKEVSSSALHSENIISSHRNDLVLIRTCINVFGYL